ncbi:RHS repeat-associated core domain-containing protein [Clostridium gasigenes]|uniref:RHS repeat-associated core domain-containing protein n=1 Tax=Clostridium gasigenes TaxID=94869 RepID=UPI001C0BEEA9|nr:RHS repeat-associated core domain-containing protein [Clostridium gasigenes]MBU3107989.1 hypothetical protein [Clostridium gasigenes]
MNQQVKTITKEGNTLVSRYNKEGILESKSASGKTLISYTYDRNNNIKSIKDITGKSSGYSYDNANRVKEIKDNNKNSLAVYDYYKNDNVKTLTVGNGLKTDYTYDGDGNVQSLVTISSTGEVLVDYNYAYDLNGNRLQKLSSKHKNFYGYDSMNRLKDSSYDGRKESFDYDKVGNRLSKTTNDITEKYVYNVKNQLKELHNKNEINYFTYDKQGNTIKEEVKDGNNIFEYNTLNQQVKAITKEGNTLVSRYDTEGLRAEIEENERLTKFIFHKENILVETDGDYNSISRFVRGYEVVAADIADGDLNSELGSRYFYSQDEQGSTIYITDKEQRIKNEYSYDAFGNGLDSREDVHNRITYTGQQFDGITQQYYLRARFYNPVIGRFTQEDVYRGDGLNLYAYCGNNPVVYYDPSGYSCETKASAFGEMSHEDGKRYREHWESLNNKNVDYESKIRNYRGIDLGGMDPKYLADPKYIVEMPYAGKSKKNSNSQGWKRDSKLFFKELQSKHPEIFGKKNTSLIKKGNIPIVDEKIIEHFPQYTDNLDEVIRHHHIGGGGQAMPIPDSLHPGYGGIHNVEKEAGILTDHSIDGLFADEAENIKNSTVRTRNWKRMK